MAQNEQFHIIANQRGVATVMTYNKLADDDTLLPVDFCDAGHGSEQN